MKLKITIGLAFSALLIICFAFNLPSSNKPNLNAFSGEELFKGIYFNQGTVAAIINGSTKAAEQTNAYNRPSAVIQANYLVAAIKKSDVQYFNNFKNVIQSGDQIAIQASLLKGQKQLDQILLTSFNTKTASGNSVLPGAGVAMLPYLTYVVLPPPPVLDIAVTQVVTKSAISSELAIQKISIHSLHTEALINTISEEFKYMQ